jgi:hypothetical protein
MKYAKLKEELKASAQKIRKLKSERKKSEFGYVRGLSSEQRTFRHKHIVYCLLRGRTMEQIEPKVREGNEPSEYLINRYRGQYEKAICDCGRKTEEETPSSASGPCRGPIFTGPSKEPLEQPKFSDTQKPELERSFVSGVLNVCRHILG